jgi:hypothetical protein
MAAERDPGRAPWKQTRDFDGCDVRRRSAGLVASPTASGLANEILDHLAAWQEPDLFTTDIRAAFRSLR